jgi:hypothetical protein
MEQFQSQSRQVHAQDTSRQIQSVEKVAHLNLPTIVQIAYL